jgi:hypothetical protein
MSSDNGKELSGICMLHPQSEAKRRMKFGTTNMSSTSIKATVEIS